MMRAALMRGVPAYANRYRRTVPVRFSTLDTLDRLRCRGRGRIRRHGPSDLLAHRGPERPEGFHPPLVLHGPLRDQQRFIPRQCRQIERIRHQSSIAREVRRRHPIHGAVSYAQAHRRAGVAVCGVRGLRLEVDETTVGVEDKVTSDPLESDGAADRAPRGLLLHHVALADDRSPDLGRLGRGSRVVRHGDLHSPCLRRLSCVES
mmetsp:Transcript_28391/g.67673  ORF Transcript_28391/g.67673 Transcript_28391/m.67673 type:complete len:205 (+) Transcript_28391:171-785(+)